MASHTHGSSEGSIRNVQIGHGEVANRESQQAIEHEHHVNVGGSDVPSSQSADIDDDVDSDDEIEGNRKGRKKNKKVVASRSMCWEHFDKFFCDVDKVQKARCKHCSSVLKADPRMHGTNSLKNHLKSCKKKPQEVQTSQSRLAFQPSRGRGNDQDVTFGTWRFDQGKAVDALCSMIVVDEFPFKIVENEGFRHFLSVVCPMFRFPSRKTLTKDVYNMYVNERDRLKSLVKNQAQTVCITTDTWTSIQRINYMCLTAHFIDDDWNLRKKILNFSPILGHKGEEVGNGVEQCLLEWGIDKIFTITVDNASSNDGAIAYLKNNCDVGTSILGGKYIHMRYIAHIINLVVQNGLKEKNDAISCIRGAVRYIRNSPSRLKRFFECAKTVKLETTKGLSLDVPTRWNSTYLMLESAIYFSRAFRKFGDVDAAFVSDLSKEPFCGVPTADDWERANLLVKFLRHFYKLTLSISGSSYVTSNVVFHEITTVDLLLRDWLDEDDKELKSMARRMKLKFDKYWGSIDKMNKILYYAVILDPRSKWELIDFSFDRLYPDCVTASMMKEQVRCGMQELFTVYKLRYGVPDSPIAPQLVSGGSSSSIETNAMYLFDEMRKRKRDGKGERVKSELDKYLSEDIEDPYDGFDILKWWKLNSHRFPILSKMARDILVVPVSTVASESAFSTGGRVLDAFRSSLSPKIVQALICVQDWIRRDSKPINLEEDLSEIENIEKELESTGVDTSAIVI